MQASCTPNMKVSIQILRPINFVHLTNQTGGILHTPLPLHKVARHRVLVTTTSLVSPTSRPLCSAFNYRPLSFCVSAPCRTTWLMETLTRRGGEILCIRKPLILRHSAAIHDQPLKPFIEQQLSYGANVLKTICIPRN